MKKLNYNRPEHSAFAHNHTSDVFELSKLSDNNNDEIKTKNEK